MELRKLELHSDYDAIQEYVRRARLERNAALSQAIAKLIVGAADACKGFFARVAAVRPGARRAAGASRPPFRAHAQGILVHRVKKPRLLHRNIGAAGRSQQGKARDRGTSASSGSR